MEGTARAAARTRPPTPRCVVEGWGRDDDSGEAHEMGVGEVDENQEVPHERCVGVGTSSLAERSYLTREDAVEIPTVPFVLRSPAVTAPPAGRVARFVCRPVSADVPRSERARQVVERASRVVCRRRASQPSLASVMATVM